MPASRLLARLIWSRGVAIVGGLLVAIFGVGILGSDLLQGQAQSRSSTPVAVVYRDKDICRGCSEAVADMLRQSPRDFDVRYIGPEEKLKLKAANLEGVALYAQPGGNGSVERTWKSLDRSEARAIKDYVSGGGHYVGFCMGAYLAGSGPGLGLLSPGNTDQYIHTRGASVTMTRDAVIPIKWEGNSRLHFAQDPSYIIPSGVVGEKILSRFSNGKVNSLVKPYGKGGVGVVGTHPEATRAWYTDRLWNEDKDKLDTAQGLRLIEQTMRL